MAYTAGAQKSVLLYSGLNPQVVNVREDVDASANTWYDRDCVSFETATGYVIIATAGKIVGIAQKAATGVDYTAIPVELIDPHSIYTARVKYDVTTTEALIGDCQDVVFDTGRQYLDASGTTDTYVVGIHPVDGLKLAGRLLFRFRYSLFAEQF